MRHLQPQHVLVRRLRRHVRELRLLGLHLLDLQARRLRARWPAATNGYRHRTLDSLPEDGFLERLKFTNWFMVQECMFNPS